MYTASPVPSELEGFLPEPKGWKLLIAIANVKEKTAGGIIMPDNLKDAEKTASITGYVVRMGPQAYTDTERYSEPWCSIGDYVVFRSYAGTRLKVGDMEFRIINEDEVEGTVPDPSKIARAF